MKRNQDNPPTPVGSTVLVDDWTIYMSSELQHGIVKQPPETCPLIDSAKDDVIKAIGLLTKPDDDNPGQMVSDMDDAEWHVDQVKGALEEIREANEKIRAWGQEWKDLALKLNESHELLTA